MQTFKQFLTEDVKIKKEDFQARSFVKPIIGKLLTQYGYTECSESCVFNYGDMGYKGESDLYGRIIYSVPFVIPDSGSELNRLVVFYYYGYASGNRICFTGQAKDSRVYNFRQISKDKLWSAVGEYYKEFAELNAENQYQELKKNQQNIEDKYGQDLKDI